MENFEVICTYTRADALRDNVQVDISKLAKEYGFILPVFVTEAVYEIVKESTNYGLNSKDGVLWDILTMLRYTIKTSNQNNSGVPFKVLITWENRKHKEFEFIAMVEAMDYNDPSPALTITTSKDM